MSQCFLVLLRHGLASLPAFSLLGGVRRRPTGGQAVVVGPLRFWKARALLERHILPSVTGVVYHDLTGNGLTADYPPLSGVTVNLFRDGGNGQFDGKAVGGDDTLVATTTTDSTGTYRFDKLSVGTYWVQQLGVPGLVIPSGTGVAKVSVTSSDLQGVAGTTIDSFDTTAQVVSDSFYGGKTVSSSAGTYVPAPGGTGVTSRLAAPEALGGERELFVQPHFREGFDLARRQCRHSRLSRILFRFRRERHRTQSTGTARAATPRPLTPRGWARRT